MEVWLNHLSPARQRSISIKNFHISTGSTGTKTVLYLVLYHLLGTGTGTTGTGYENSELSRFFFLRKISRRTRFI